MGEGRERARLRVLAGGLGFAEGPAWTDTGGGRLVLSDMRAGAVLEYSEHAGLRAIRWCVEPNGNAFDAWGRLLTCEHGARAITITDDAGTRVLVRDHEGRRFNSPNDLALHPDGSIWFTDPSYGLHGRPREIEVDGVYRFDPTDRSTRLVADDFARPNGIAFSPDHRWLYVADSGAPALVRRFLVAGKDRLEGGEVFYDPPGPPDGLAVDEDGRLYVAARDGIHVVAASGAPLGRIAVPEPTTNVAFGGEDRRTLFVTGRSRLYSISLQVKGMRFEGASGR